MYVLSSFSLCVWNWFNLTRLCWLLLLNKIAKNDNISSLVFFLSFFLNLYKLWQNSWWKCAILYYVPSIFEATREIYGKNGFKSERSSVMQSIGAYPFVEKTANWEGRKDDAKWKATKTKQVFWQRRKKKWHEQPPNAYVCVCGVQQ